SPRTRKWCLPDCLQPEVAVNKANRSGAVFARAGLADSDARESLRGTGSLSRRSARPAATAALRSRSIPHQPVAVSEESSTLRPRCFRSRDIVCRFSSGALPDLFNLKGLKWPSLLSPKSRRRVTHMHRALYLRKSPVSTVNGAAG
ncbi:hypothetical protein GBAR_LOCUS9830, partial [Geodia barretti]